MNVLCPSCHSSIPVSEADPVLHCDSCGLTTHISSLGTLSGGSALPVERDLSGETVGGYQLLSLLGIGGMGVVYRATRLSDDASVAVKILHASYEHQRAEFVARFEREARALARLEHPSIVRILDSGRQDDHYFIVTEHVAGSDLAQRLKASLLPLEEVVSITRQLCGALAFAHQKGVVHRDIKPANIMVHEGSVKLLDFGLAQITAGDSQFSSLTRTDLAMGTFNYLSPEQRMSAKSVDKRSDLFSLGVVFYEMLTGTLPLGSFQAPSRLRADADRHCDRVVERSLNTDPKDRYGSAEEMAADIARIGLSTTLRRRRTAAAVAGLAAAAAVAWSLSRGEQGEGTKGAQGNQAAQAATHATPPGGPRDGTQTAPSELTAKPIQDARTAPQEAVNAAPTMALAVPQKSRRPSTEEGRTTVKQKAVPRATKFPARRARVTKSKAVKAEPSVTRSFKGQLAESLQTPSPSQPQQSDATLNRAPSKEDTLRTQQATQSGKGATGSTPSARKLDLRNLGSARNTSSKPRASSYSGASGKRKTK